MKPETEKFSRIVTEPAYKSVSRMLEQKIVSGEIKIGEALPSELGLAEYLGVNRSTVREGIRALEEMGLVARRRGQKRLFVTLPATVDLSRHISTAMVLNEITFFELWETMLVMEASAAYSAAERITDDELQLIGENIKETRKALADNLSLVKLDVEFHELVAAATKNRALNLARIAVGDLFFPAFYSVMSRLNAGERLLIAHEKIYEALKQHNAKTAKDWMERHIVDFRRGYELANLNIDAPITHMDGAHFDERTD